MLFKEEQVITISKKDPQFEKLRFLILALSKDETRQVLMRIKVEESRLIATDGRRLHIWHKKGVFKPGLYSVFLKSAARIVLSYDCDLDTECMKYPDISSITDPINFPGYKELSYCTFSVFCYDVFKYLEAPCDLDYLKAAFKSLPQSLRYKGAESTFKLVGEDCETIIMPMRR